ncbi:MAG: tRNA (adenosine(37)-N6)-threonylcarbamoyltransferase complex ATPase subunit type 1 TsaE [Synechococcales bacterium]|nr:tRNA (adenosine(37)-N6)-threonylcarbamoyltransferase complex ATPase subunit type 1 TsaE [Synechococcales bacterium]
MASILQLADANQTYQLGQHLGRSLRAGSVLLLEGNLGAGKTTLVQGIGAGLGIPDSIESPTFTLINEYLEGRLPLYHLDLYRLDRAEAAELHLETYWEGLEVEPGILAIEWSDRLPYYPASYLRLQLDYLELAAQPVKTAENLPEVLAEILPGRKLMFRAIGTALWLEAAIELFKGSCFDA